MFLQTLNRLSKLSTNGSSRFYALELKSRQINEGVHKISVTGKIGNIMKFENGTVTFLVKSMCPNNFIQTHKVVVTGRNGTLLDMAQNLLEVEQKIHLSGKLNTSRFKTESGRNRNTSVIMATELSIVSDVAVENSSENLQSDVHIDENKVEITGILTTDVGGENFKTFTLASLKAPNLSLNEPGNFGFNQIFVYDKDLFPILSDAHPKMDEFFIRGGLNYRREKNEYGKTITTSYIIAKEIYRI